MITRAQMFEASRTSDPYKAHRAYYRQFVTPALQQAVVAKFGLPLLIDALAQDRNLNTIAPVQRWDGFVQPGYARAALKARGDFWSLANGVCIAKEAARMAVEDYQARESDK